MPIDLPPKLWLPPKPAIIHSEKARVGSFPFPTFVPQPTVLGFSFLQYTDDAAFGATHTLTSVNFGPSAPNRYLILSGVFYQANVTAVSIGGVSATIVKNQIGTSGFVTATLAIAAVPSGTSGTVVVTLDAGESGIIALHRAVNLTSATPYHTASDIGDALSMSINVPEGGFVIACGGYDVSSAAVTTAGVTEDYDFTPSGDGTRAVGGSASGLSAQTGRTVSFTQGGGGNPASVAASWL